MMEFKNRLTTMFGATVAAAGLFAVTSMAQATLSLRVIDGVTTIATINDGGAGDLNPVSGAVTFIGSFGAAITNIDSGLSKPIIGSITAPELHLDGLLASSGAISLTLMLSDTDFSGSSVGDFFASIGGILGGGLGSNITYSVYRDLSNSLFGTGAANLVCSVRPLTSSPFGGNCVNTLGLDSDYSITLVAALNHTGAGSSSFNAVVSDDVVVPEPSTMILLGIGMIGVAAWSKRKTMAERYKHQHTERCDDLLAVIELYGKFSAFTRSGTMRSAHPLMNGIVLKPSDATSLVVFLKLLNEDYN